MDEQQPTFKVVDRRLFNPDGTPRELSPEEKQETDRVAESLKIPAVDSAPKPAPQADPEPQAKPAPPSRPATAQRPAAHAHTGGDPLDDPASFLSLIMSLASNAAANLGMMPHPATGETGVDLATAKHWIDVLGMLEKKTSGNLDPQESQVIEGLLADLRMQFVSLQNAPTPPPSKFSASDITGGK
jgi:Domain of unknown function (DUF1844)